MAVVLDVVNAALKEIGVLAIGETATADDSIDALATLNRLLDQWAAERLQIHTVTRTLWTITTGVGTYAVASGSVVNVARPVYIDHVNFVDTSATPDLEQALNPLTEDAYSRIAQKALTSPFPTCWYYNPTYPTGTLELWPVPTSTTIQGVLYAPAAVVAFAALTTTVALPPGYERMIIKNLAMELSPSYGRAADQVLMQQAVESKEVVKRSNRRLMDLSVDAGALLQGRGTYDINSGP